jgi:hypothetical protein
MGYVSVITTSIYDIMQVQQNLEALEALMHGDLRNIPLILSRRFQMISTPEIDKQGNRTGKRARREKWLISLEPSPGWVQRQLAAMHQHALDTTTVLSLPDLERDYDVDDETGESIEPEMPAMSSNGNGDKLSHPNQENADRLKYLRNAMPILSLDTPDLPDSLRGVRIAEMPSDILDKATRDTRTHIAAHVKELQAQARRLDINASTDINEKTGMLTDKALIDLARRLAEMVARHEKKQQQNQATTYRLTPDDVPNDAHDVSVAAIEA